MDFYTVHSKIASQELFTVEEVMFAIRMMESQIEYWVATKIRAQRTGEDDTSIQETLDTLASNLNYLLGEKKRLIAHGFLGNC